MKIDKSCETCEFNFSGKCADAKYGEPASHEDDQECWSMGFDYFDELMDLLPENIQVKIRHSDNIEEMLLKHISSLVVNS